MSGTLTPEQVEHYQTQGFVNRIPIFTPDEAGRWLARLEDLERAELDRRGGDWKDRDFRPWVTDDHPMFAWANELVRTPALLDAVESLLGPDILVRNADIFVKNPGLRRDIGWHVDTAEKGADADQLLTVWLGLTESTRKNGCILYSAGTHRREIPNGPKDKHSLTFTREAIASLRPQDTALNEMEAGMCSMHHFRIAHASGPNRSDARRIGFVVRFMSPDIQPETAESGAATVVRGSDRRGRFHLRDKFPMTWTM
ncbi:MAG TPA: phytanoyl-CoA dioxygenase family protein [Myxococcota bacterium]|nr:phytanoyl-CoA dioxygenase family protein [Myxococcota bacterium]